MRVAISGGGIAGLSVAAILAERGHCVQVFERSHGARSMGAGVVCFANATLVLRHFGLEERLREVAGKPLTMRRMSSDGQRLGDLSLATINHWIGAPSYSVLRTDLHRLLSDFARERGAQIEYGREVRGVSEEGHLVFEDGGQLAADWVIGADGRMASPLRKYVLGDNAPRYGGFVNWIGVTQSDRDVFDPSVVFDIWGCGERFGVVPITRRTAYFAGGAAASLEHAHHAGLLPKLEMRFANWPRPVAEALAAADPSSLREIYVHDHDPIDVWHRGKVLLVGDAAHAPLPTSGQGACQALEDAFHLGQMLDRGVSLDPAEFFPRWTGLRREKTNAIIASGRGFAARLFNEDAEFVSERNRLSQRSDLAETAKGMARLWSRSLSLP